MIMVIAPEKAPYCCYHLQGDLTSSKEGSAATFQKRIADVKKTFSFIVLNRKGPLTVHPDGCSDLVSHRGINMSSHTRRTSSTSTSTSI